MECTNNPNPAVSQGSGNPYNKFDSIDECERTCFRKAVIIMLNCYYVSSTTERIIIIIII